MLDEDMNSLLLDGLHLNDKTIMALKSLCYIMKSKLSELNEYSDQIYYDNDYNQYTFFNGLLKSSVPDNTIENNTFNSFITNFQMTYNISRTEYIEKEYKKKKLRQPIKR